jgi:putative membrane protein
MTTLIRSIVLAAFLAAGSAAAQQQATDNPDNPHSTKAKDKQTADVPSSNQQIQQGETQNPQSPDYRPGAGTASGNTSANIDAAEQNNPHHPDAQNRETASAGQGQMDHEAMMKNATPQQMLQRLHMANLHEIEMAKMAQQNGTEKIKSYAQTLVRDHQDADGKVKDLAQKKSVTLSDAPRNPEMQQKMEMDKEHLSGLKGQQFDKAFAGRMAGEHRKVIDMAQAFRQGCSDQDVCSLIDTLMPKLQQHEQMALQLRGPTAQGRAPETNR